MNTIREVNDQFSILDCTPIGYFVINEDFTVLFWNRCLEEWTKITRDQIVNTSILNQFPHLGTEKYHSRIKNTLMSGLPTLFSSQLHKHFIPAHISTGKSLFQHIVVTRVTPSEEGKFYALFAIQDVTGLSKAIDRNRLAFKQINKEIGERKQAESAMREEKNMAQKYLDTAAVMFIVIKADQRIKLINKRGCEILGYKEGEILGKNWFDTFLPQRIRNEMKLAFHNLMIGEVEPVEYDESPILAKSGKEKIIAWHNTIIKDEQGKVISSLSAGEDITERKRTQIQLLNAKKEAEEANLAKSQFLANMSHEIRTPINGVLGLTTLLLDTELNAEQLDYAEGARKAGESLLILIDDILDYSKIEAGKLDIETIDFNLRTVVEDVIDVLGMNACDKGLELIYLIHQDVPALLKGDPGRLRQIIMNLLGNAIKFTEKGEVLIRITSEDDEETITTVRFEIIDTGIGISQDRMHGLFQLFSQGDTSTTRKYGGTGLGLAISKKLSKMMGGQIGVESQEGKGSTFWFTAVFKKQIENRWSNCAVTESIQGKRILVVDDNDMNRLALKEQLHVWDCRFDEASRGIDALDKLHAAVAEHDPFSIVIIDMHMPDMGGEVLGQKIKEDPDLSDTIMVMLTSMGRRGDGAQMKDIGFAAYLTKPVKQSQLYDCLVSITNKKAMGNEGSSNTLVTKHSIAEARKSKHHILLAEDNEMNQKVAVRFIMKKGHRVVVANNGKKAVEAFENGQYDLILMDIQMPEMDGIEATRKIRSMETKRGRKIPIIALTAHAMKGDKERFLQAGMDDYITKPFKRKDLEKVIAKWMEEVRYDGAEIDRKPEQSQPTE